MILVDTSAWIEFLRGTESTVCREVERILGGDLAVTDEDFEALARHTELTVHRPRSR